MLAKLPGFISSSSPGFISKFPEESKPDVFAKRRIHMCKTIKLLSITVKVKDAMIKIVTLGRHLLLLMQQKNVQQEIYLAI